MLNKLSMKQRVLLNLFLNIGLQVYVVAGALSGMKPWTLAIGSIVIGSTIILLYLDAAKTTGEFLGNVMEGAARMSKGDLSVDIRLSGNATARQGLLLVQTLQDTLRAMMSTIRDGADKLNAAASEIAQGNKDLSERTEQGSFDLQAAAGSMRSMTDAVGHSSEALGQASTLAQTTSEGARHSGEVVGKAVEAMSAVSASSKRIADIIGVIDGIAFQTNILALNAAVEAARAGEQGRGFAVVAAEVRSLAQRSAEAAREIKSLITNSVEQVDRGSKLVNDAGSRMQGVVGSVEEVARLLADSTDMVRTQMNGLKDISDSIERLDYAMQQNAAMVEEGAAAAESLTVQAGRLQDVMRRFNAR